MSDERFTEEERAAHEAAKRIPIRQAPPPVPCRKYVDDPVTAAEVEEFMKSLEESK
jgi:hypothetical protein